MKDGRLNKCKECVKKRVLKHREKNIERIREYDRERSKKEERRKKNRENAERYCRENPERYKAQTAVSNAVRDGRLYKPDRCSECGSSGRLHGHHPDYSQPLMVVWLCVPCHSKRRKRQ